MIDRVKNNSIKRDYEMLKNYLCLAQSALEKENFHKAKDYANKILENDLTDSNAWLIKMKCAIIQGDYVDLSETIFCGQEAIENADYIRKDDIKTEVYTFFLTEIYKILDYIYIFTSDTKDIKKYMGLRSLTNIYIASGESRELDEEMINIILCSCEEVTKAKAVIPEEEIKKSKEYQDLINLIIDKFNGILEVLGKRMKIYNGELSVASQARVEQILRTLQIGSYRELERMLQAERKRAKQLEEWEKKEELKRIKSQAEFKRKVKTIAIISTTILLLFTSIAMLKDDPLSHKDKTSHKAFSGNIL